MKLTVDELLADPRFRTPSGDLTHEAANALHLAQADGSQWVDVDEPASVVPEILEAKWDCGRRAYLWLNTSGDCILWESKEASEDDPTGIHAAGRWQLSPPEVEELADTGQADIVW